MRIHSLVAAGAALLFTSSLPTNATAGPSEEIIQLTHQLDNDIHHLREDFRNHYRATWQYAGLLNLLSQVESQNNVVNGISHNNMAGARVLENNIEKLDGHVHQLHEAVDDVGQGASRSKIIGDPTAIHRHLSHMTRTIHRMEDIADARVKYYGRQHGYSHQQAQQVQVVRTPFGYLQLNQGQSQPQVQHQQRQSTHNHNPTSSVGLSNQWNRTPKQTQPKRHPQAQQQPRTYPQAQQPTQNSGGSIFDRLRSKLRNR